MEAVYPGLFIGVLSSATIGELPEGVLVDLGGEQITQKQLDATLAKAPDKLKEQLAKNSLFLAQELATPRLLLRAAREWAAAEKKDVEGKAEPDIISDYLQSVVADVSVSDAEVRGVLRRQPGHVQRSQAGRRQGDPGAVPEEDEAAGEG